VISCNDLSPDEITASPNACRDLVNGIIVENELYVNNPSCFVVEKDDCELRADTIPAGFHNVLFASLASAVNAPPRAAGRAPNPISTNDAGMLDSC